MVVLDTDESTKSSGIITSTTDVVKRFYPIGLPGVAWTSKEDDQWKATTKLQRSYEEEVLDKLNDIVNPMENESTDLSLLQLDQYGALSHDPERYPLMAVRTKHWNPELPSVLVTGGVHGYETSGVQGAIQFLREHKDNTKWLTSINLVVAPCVSPWAYEHIQRWQADLKDPNRSFVPDDESRQSEESKALMQYLQTIAPLQDATNKSWTCHLDLHETTDTDETEFMPAKHAKAGQMFEGEVIPDGFYLVGDETNPQLEFQRAVIASVRKVTHIAPPDANGKIIDVPIVPSVDGEDDDVGSGIIVVPAKELGLCCSVTGGTYVTTTEVYPDSPKVTDEICNQAQVAAIVGAMEYVLAKQ